MTDRLQFHKDAFAFDWDAPRAFETINGYPVILNPFMTMVRVTMRDRTWRERLFTRPWRPWLKVTHTEVIMPSDECYVVNGHLVMHPEMLRTLRNAYRVTLTLICLAFAVPVAAQTVRVYTNADLTRPSPTAPRTTIAEETMKGLVARQFAWYPTYPERPMELRTVVVQTTTPVAFPRDPFCCRLDGSPWTVPPWTMTAYTGHERRRPSYATALPARSTRRR
jgi:hypothetical protein